MAAFVTIPWSPTARRPRAQLNRCRPHASVQPSTNALVRFPALAPERFRHPVDVAATQALSSVLGLEMVVSRLLRLAESVMELENISTGVEVSSKQLPQLHASLSRACEILDIKPVPTLYVRQSPVPNAYTLAFRGRAPCIVVHTSLLELLTPDETYAVLAHELGHLKCEHGLWMTAANLLANLMPREMSELMSGYILRWSRAAELTCDRASLLATQDSRVVMSMMMKLTGGTKKYADDMNVDEFVAQAEKFDFLSSQGPIGRAVRNAMILASTHPLPVHRARELKRWADSNHFQSILAGGKPYNIEQRKEAT